MQTIFHFPSFEVRYTESLLYGKTARFSFSLDQIFNRT